ncbi:alcohol dehydrogenase catalytic domain-containing protein [Mycobacterium sp. AZCC_0083]|uniref:alcohol dehydrogenase catalytic domain-containing protein n=1 Tax=Mycobacterium sp. AZCC_0083 TaxID=2735882 RepID=UPI0035CA1F94
MVTVGAEVAEWTVGQRAAVNPNGNVCRACEFCLSGRPNFCQADGGLALLMATFSVPPAGHPAGLGPT